MHLSTVITRPFYDDTTSYLHQWNLPIVKFARKHLKSVADLEGKRANRKELESVLKKLKPEVIILNGHGSINSILGQNHEELIKVGTNEYILKGSHVYALSCSTGANLASMSVKSGAKSFIGYKQEFIFAISEGYSTRATKYNFYGVTKRKRTRSCT